MADIDSIPILGGVTKIIAAPFKLLGNVSSTVVSAATADTEGIKDGLGGIVNSVFDVPAGALQAVDVLHYGQDAINALRPERQGFTGNKTVAPDTALQSAKNAPVEPKLDTKNAPQSAVSNNPANSAPAKSQKTIITIKITPVYGDAPAQNAPVAASASSTNADEPQSADTSKKDDNNTLGTTSDNQDKGGKINWKPILTGAAILAGTALLMYLFRGKIAGLFGKKTPDIKPLKLLSNMPKPLLPAPAVVPPATTTAAPKLLEWKPDLNQVKPTIPFPPETVKKPVALIPAPETVVPATTTVAPKLLEWKPELSQIRPTIQFPQEVIKKPVALLPAPATAPVVTATPQLDAAVKKEMDAMWEAAAQSAKDKKAFQIAQAWAEHEAAQIANGLKVTSSAPKITVSPLPAQKVGYDTLTVGQKVKIRINRSTSDKVMKANKGEFCSLMGGKENALRKNQAIREVEITPANLGQIKKLYKYLDILAA